MKWSLLFLAIALEVLGTLLLKFSNGGQKLTYSILSLVLYASSLWCLSIVLKYMQINIAYAIWSGLGLIALTIIQFLVFNEAMSFWKLFFAVLIIIGIAGLNLSTKH